MVRYPAWPIHVFRQGGDISVTASCTGCENTTAVAVGGLTYGDIWVCSGREWGNRETVAKQMPQLKLWLSLSLSLSLSLFLSSSLPLSLSYSLSLSPSPFSLPLLSSFFLSLSLSLSTRQHHRSVMFKLI